LPAPVAKSARTIDLQSHGAAAASLPTLLISADSHATEPPELWRKLPSHIQERLPLFKGRNPRPPGATDPKLRILDMDKDHVAAEVLFPDRGLGLFAAEQDVQEHAFALYNDWIAEYCAYAPRRLFAPVTLACYDIDKAIKEMQRGYDLGLRGVLFWEMPDPRLPFHSPHYEKLWAAASEMDMPLMMHILTGFNQGGERPRGMESVRFMANHGTSNKINMLFDILWSGVFERFPKLKLGLIESEIGWAPFILQQWDYYYHRLSAAGPAHEDFAITRQPSDIFRDHVYATFIDDVVGTQMLNAWGENNCMWSSDYPHPNMTWPHSREFAARQIGTLSYEKQERLLSKNAIDFFKLPL
jgi:predicted TIM-barrel fold metal-dependent hydrolase